MSDDIKECIEDSFDCPVASYAVECLPCNIAVLKSLTTDKRTLKILETLLRSHEKLSEISVVVHNMVEDGIDEEELRTAYNLCRARDCEEDW